MNYPHSIYSLDDFVQKFIDFDFDNLLNEQNNPHVHSNQHYLQIKQTYISQSQENYSVMVELLSNFEPVLNNYTKNVSGNVIRHHYNLVNDEYKESLNSKIKSVWLNQKRIFSHFLQYINFLNDSYNTTRTTQKHS